MVQIEEQLAKRWMPGYRETARGEPKRLAWEHPQDLVLLLSAAPGLAVYEYLLQLAWLHDIIEDGKKEDGSAVTSQDLEAQGISELMIHDVQVLSQRPSESKLNYLARLQTETNLPTRIVKCVDRICNLREGARCFKDKRWARYVRETNEYIIPLAKQLPEPIKNWAMRLLEDAISLRKVSNG